jgi:predicted alpha/beta-fold hydrolase
VRPDKVKVMPAEIPEFEPHAWLRTGHLQTMVGPFLRRKFVLPPSEERLFRVDDETQLKGMCHWQPGKRLDAPVIVIVHGLEGSCDSKYAIGIADKAYQRGFHAVRMNQRNCGGTELLTPTLYNSGMSGDYRAILMELIEKDGFDQVFFAGYSMGGNLVTKMAGEFGDSGPKQLRGVAVVCPALNLSACADALEKRENCLYQRHFVKGLLARYRRKAELFPKHYSKNGFGRVRTVREFDDKITAPAFGYKDAQEYYEAAGAKRVIGQVKVPVLMMTAQDDPFVPYHVFQRARVSENPLVRFVAPKQGGHCGFISKWEGAERFWAEERIAEFCQEEAMK